MNEKKKTCADCLHYCVHCMYCHWKTIPDLRFPDWNACEDFVDDSGMKLRNQFSESHVKMINEAASAMGKKGGKSKSDRKVAAARLNIKKASDAQTDEVRNQRIQNASKSQANRNEAISLISLKCTITSPTDFTRALHSIYGRKMSWETIFEDIHDGRLTADTKSKRLILANNRKKKESLICIV